MLHSTTVGPLYNGNHGDNKKCLLYRGSLIGRLLPIMANIVKLLIYRCIVANVTCFTVLESILLTLDKSSLEPLSFSLSSLNRQACSFPSSFNLLQTSSCKKSSKKFI